MLSRKTIEAYLFFLLRHRILVSIVVAAITVGLAGFMWFRMHVFTNFFDLYPKDHPYIQLYQQYRNMFGTANIKVSTRANAVVVPNEAVQWLGNAQMVFISHDGGCRFEPRRVTTGISRGALTEIVDGLLPGEPVVTAGSFMLKSELLRRHE